MHKEHGVERLCYEARRGDRGISGPGGQDFEGGLGTLGGENWVKRPKYRNILAKLGFYRILFLTNGNSIGYNAAIIAHGWSGARSFSTRTNL